MAVVVEKDIIFARREVGKKVFEAMKKFEYLLPKGCELHQWYGTTLEGRKIKRHRFFSCLDHSEHAYFTSPIDYRRPHPDIPLARGEDPRKSLGVATNPNNDKNDEKMIFEYFNKVAEEIGININIISGGLYIAR